MTFYTPAPGTVESILRRINTVAKERVGRKLREEPYALLLERTFATAAKHIVGGQKKQRRPLTIDILLKIRPLFDFTTHDDRALWAILCLGVFALARIGELTPGPKAELKVTIGSVTIRGDHGKLFLVGTKTDRKKEGTTLHFFRNNTDCCPVTAMRAYLTGLKRSNAKSPLFADSKGNRLPQTWVVQRMRKFLTRIGLKGAEYSGISLRRGGAQMLLRLHASDKIIMGMGRWKSACFRRYLKVEEEDIKMWQRRMAVAE